MGQEAKRVMLVLRAVQTAAVISGSRHLMATSVTPPSQNERLTAVLANQARVCQRRAAAPRFGRLDDSRRHARIAKQPHGRSHVIRRRPQRKETKAKQCGR